MDYLLKVDDYIIRHFKLYDWYLKKQDSKYPDVVSEIEGDACEKLSKYYEATPFSCDGHNVVSEIRYNLQIVIPMYNVQKYVISCIHSILNQKTHYSYKIVIVDDGSTDYAVAEIKSMFKDAPIQIIEQMNKGTAAARNAGFSQMEADYVMFVDADDKLKQGAIEKLLDKAYSEKACVVEGGYELFSNGVGKRVSHENAIVEEPYGKLWGFSWGKVISSNLLASVIFPVGYWFEDIIISYFVYTKCKKAVTVSDTVYCYRRNKQGFSHKRGNDVKLLDSFWVLKYSIEELIDKEFVITSQMYDLFLGSMLTCSRRLMYMNDDIRKDVLEAFCEILKRNFEDKKTEDKILSVFERVVRNNDYEKYKRIIIGINE